MKTTSHLHKEVLGPHDRFVCGYPPTVFNHAWEMQEHVGEGCYAEVKACATNPKYVRKLERNTNTAYVAYAEWLLKNKMHERCKAFPRITHAYEINGKMLYRMEYLESVYDTPRSSAFVNAARSFVYDPEYGPAMLRAGAKLDELFALKAISDLYHKSGASGLGLDLHSGNYRYRPSDDTIVITDPFYGRDLSKAQFDRILAVPPTIELGELPYEAS